MFWADLRGRQEHLASEWTVPRMARGCGLGATQFIHLTWRLFNMTPVQFLAVCRLEAASAMLRAYASAGIAEVAAVCGFASSRYFSTQFRRHFHCTPSEWKSL